MLAIIYLPKKKINKVSKNMTNYVSIRRIEEKQKKVIVDICGCIINENPTKEDLKGLILLPSKKEIAKDEDILLEFLRYFSDNEGRHPTSKDFINNPKYPSYNTYRRVFGSWSNVLKIIQEYIKGFDRSNGKTIKWYNSDEELLDSLTSFERKNGRAPIQKDFENNPDYPSVRPYITRFGSWANALKLVELDVDSMVRKGIVENSKQKARLSEIKVIEHFKRKPVDLAGDNCCSPCDGICPNGKTYDVKSSKLHKGKYYYFHTRNKYKEEIEIYYLLGFNEDYTILEHAWRVPGEIVEKDSFIIAKISYTRNSRCVESMKEYEITDRIKDTINEKVG